MNILCRLATHCDYRTIANACRLSKSSAIRWTNQVNTILYL